MPFDAGSIQGKLELNTKGWDQSVSRIKADQQGLGAQAGQTGAAFGGLWKQVAGGISVAYLAGKAVRVFSDFMTESVRAAIEAEDAENNLRAALESTGRAVDPLLAHFKNYSAALQKQTVYDDEAIQGAQALLLQLTKLDQDGLDAATRGALGLASVFKMDLTSAARMVAQGYEGNYIGLGKLIPEIRSAKTETEKQSAMMEGLARMYQRAQAETNTFGGSLKQLNNAWDDAKESVGGAITQNEDLKKAIASVTGAIRELVESGKLSEWISNAVAAINVLVKTLGLLKDGFTAAATVMSGGFAGAARSFDKEVQQAKLATDEFAASLQVLKPTAHEMVNILVKDGPAAWEAWKTATKEADDKLVENKATIEGWIQKGATFLGLVKDTTPPVKTLGETIKDMGVKTQVAKTEIESLDQALHNIELTCENQAGPAFDLISDGLRQIGIDAGQAERDATQSVTDMVNSFQVGMPKIPEAAATATIQTHDYFAGLYTDIAQGFGNTIAGIISGSTSMRDALKSIWNNILQAFGNMIGEMVTDWLLHFVKKIVDSAVDVGKSIAKSIGGALGNIGGGAGKMASSFLSAASSIANIVTAVASIVSLFKKAPTGAGDGMGRVVERQDIQTMWQTKIFEALMNSIAPILDDIKTTGWSISDKITWLSDKITWSVGNELNTHTNLLKKIADYTKSTADTIKNITKAAGGYSGTVNQPTLFVAGESGPEDVNINPRRASGSYDNRSYTNNYGPREQRTRIPITVNIDETKIVDIVNRAGRAGRLGRQVKILMATN